MSITINIEPVSFEQNDEKWLPNLMPYTYQAQVYNSVAAAIEQNKTLCLFLVTPTGSGKTLGSYAYSINEKMRAIGVYPTNELIRDQEQALQPWIDPNGDHKLLRIDSKQLDVWQDTLELRQHSQAWETLLNWEPTILTNPDILFYTFFGLYQGQAGINQRLFSLVGKYQLFIFDEFHLYNVKQMADICYLVNTLNSINPNLGRVFLFASATPASPAIPWLQERLGLDVEVIQAEPSISVSARTIAHPVELELLPADLQMWQGTQTILDYLPTIQRFFKRYPGTRVVLILDSVAGAISTAQHLKTLFPGKSIGEVHGFSSDQERLESMKATFTVGTSTIEVGIDFKDETEKDILIFEARTASQFIQRFGRLGRHEKALPIPNKITAVVPGYVYHYLKDHVKDGQNISRVRLTALVEQAYESKEDFSRYLSVHAPAELHAARWNAQSLFLSDERNRIISGLEQGIKALTGKSAYDAQRKHYAYKQDQILDPLLTFRGGGFDAAILDNRGVDRGFSAKRYNLMFLLRRGLFTEISEEEYMTSLDKFSEQWSLDVTREKRFGKQIESKPESLLGVYGYFELTALIEEARRVWFEIDEEEIRGKKAQVTVVSNLQLVTDPGVRISMLNKRFRRKKIVAWFADCHPATIKLGRALPPLFEIYELRVRRPGGSIGNKAWSIAFNQNAFFVDSLGWHRTQIKDTAIIL